MESSKPSNTIVAVKDENVEIINLSNITTTAPTSASSLPPINDEGIIQKFHLVWLDEPIDEVNNENDRNSLLQLRQLMNAVDTFVDIDKCIDFITDNEELQMFLIVPKDFAKLLVPIAQEIRQISLIYILCRDKTICKNLTNKYNKVKGIFSDMTSICRALKHAVRNFDPNSVSISFVKTNDGTAKQDLDSLDKSFMYTQILKEILLTIDFEEIHTNEFLSYCRQQFIGNSTALKNVERIAKEYRCHPPIWWYTYESFLYWMLNRALRLMQVDIIIKMGFFLKDLHKHIVALHSQQFNKHSNLNTIIAYRGQGLSQNDFYELQRTQGGLLSFNNFLSTSLDRAVSLAFAESIQSNPYMIGVLFQIIISPSINSTQFANVKNVSYYKDEEEILFSMHSIFRIGQIKQLDGNTRLWEVDLMLTSDNDPQLHKLTEYIRQETSPHLQGWERLGHLLIKLGEFDKAEQVYNVLLDQTTDEKEKGDIYHMFGWIKDDQGKYEDAVQYYEQSFQIIQKYRSPTDLASAASYNNLGLVYNNMGEYSKARSSHEKAFEIYQKTFPENHSLLATSYSNIGQVYDNMGDYSQALSSHEKALEIRQKILPEIHPDLATSYNNIGLVYVKIGEYSKALLSYEKALKIWKKTLPENHSLLATSYNNIGGVCTNMEEYSKALSSHEKALEIRQKTLPENHPDFAQSYNNIAVVYDNMREYSKALSYYEKALEIYQKTLPENHSHLATSYNNIGQMYNKIGDYSKALSSHEKALENYQKTLPENHPLLATSYNNIGLVYSNMGEYSKALSYYEKALEIDQKTLPENHPDLATSYNNLGSVYDNMGDYSNALSYYGKALEIYQKTLPENHPLLATSCNNIGSVYKNMGEYSNALSSHEKALEITQKTLPDNHPSLAISYNNIATVYYYINDYRKALQYFERALDILQRSLPSNHPHIKIVKESIEIIKEKL